MGQQKIVGFLYKLASCSNEEPVYYEQSEQQVKSEQRDAGREGSRMTSRILS